MLKKPKAPSVKQRTGAFLNLTLKENPMYEQFIELTDQLFWEGYAEQMAKEDPEKFRLELNDFLNTYQN